jgi:hypothetical protein
MNLGRITALITALVFVFGANFASAGSALPQTSGKAKVSKMLSKTSHRSIASKKKKKKKKKHRSHS